MSAAADLACGLIRPFEGLSLRAYPDPKSDLARAMRKAGIMTAYMQGRAEIPPALRGLDGAPWTIGYGETLGVHEDMWWTQEQAEAQLQRRAASFLLGVLGACPQLLRESATRQAACTSLAYNIGVKAFRLSSVSRCTMRREYPAAGDRMLLWNKGNGVVLPGLVARRKAERAMYLTA
ncbi:glycoside hydrolase family protein [Pseudoduganella sp. FT26W]|uniref:Lysozyme n=1 Tax=Duganella aquatilis TaxID=2666082 RepID=A0A844D768_9BURK|nr:glycoside hydrolase family protein [Duganella aquatilis]